ncbi:MAG: hypothetical protein ACXAAO_09550 [Candidatus Thorarchaeota archaeon]|jgi:hypothetical protein
MSDGNRRFIVPALFSIVGILSAFWLSQTLARIVNELIPAYDLVAGVEGSTGFDVNFILLILFPILLIEFIIFTLPFAFFMLVGAKIFRLATYNIDMMSIGKGFDWVRILKRSVIPALFALSLGEIIISLLRGVIFGIPEATGDTTNIARNLHPLLTFLGGLIALVVSMAVFAPTWLLNDSGIVAYVKPDHLEQRRCPDTVGVGRWYSNLVGGFGIFAFPITMFNRYFFQKFVVWGVPFDFTEVFSSLIWIVGLPIMTMAFIIPMIIINEFSINWTSGIMRRIARKFGASEVQLEQVSKIQPVVNQEPADLDSRDLFESTEQTDRQ